MIPVLAVLVRNIRNAVENKRKLINSKTMKEIIVKSFNIVAEAESAKNLLEQHDIKSIVQKKGPTAWGNVDADGADLFVAEKNVNKAREVLEENRMG